MSGQASFSYQCPFCPVYCTPTLKSWLGHIRLVHQSDPRVPCCIDQCKETFCKYSSLKSHMYRRHRDYINGDVKQKGSEEISTTNNGLLIEPQDSTSSIVTHDDSVIDPQDSTPSTVTHDDSVIDPQDSTPSTATHGSVIQPQDSIPSTVPHDDSVIDHEIDNSSDFQLEESHPDELCTDDTLSLMEPNSLMDRHVAMYLLKLKKVHHLSQVAIDCVVSGTKSLLDQHLVFVRREVEMQLQQVRLQGAEDICSGVSRIFQDICDPFAHLNSAYMQQKYF